MAVSQPRRSRSQPCKIDDLRQIVVSNLFSQLNNLTYVTLDPVYSSICGYTEDDYCERVLLVLRGAGLRDRGRACHGRLDIAVRTGGHVYRPARGESSTDDSTDVVMPHPTVSAGEQRHREGGLRHGAAPELRPGGEQRVLLVSSPAGWDTYERGETIDVPVARASTRFRASTLWFGYRVQEDDSDSDGIGIAAGALTLNGRHHQGQSTRTRRVWRLAAGLGARAASG